MLVILFYTRVCPSIRQEQSNPPWPYTSAAAAPCNIIEWLHSLWNSLTRLTKCSGRLPMRNSTRSYFCLFFFLLLLLLLLLFFGISARNIGKKNKNYVTTRWPATFLFLLYWAGCLSDLFLFWRGAISHDVVSESSSLLTMGKKNIHLCCDLIRSCNVIHLLYIPWHSFHIKIIY